MNRIITFRGPLSKNRQIINYYVLFRGIFFLLCHWLCIPIISRVVVEKFNYKSKSVREINEIQRSLNVLFISIFVIFCNIYLSTD